MCGVIGIIGSDNSRAGIAPAPSWAAVDAYRGLLALQHRGQDAAGILSYDGHSGMFSCEKDLGLAAQVFDAAKLEKLSGNMAVGHTRYATVGGNGRQDIQPMVTGIPFGLGMAHNGNILNYYSLAKKLTTDFRRQLMTSNDLEVLIHYFAQFLVEGTEGAARTETFTFDNIRQAVGRIFDTMNGGYAVVAMIANEGLVAFRDPKGIRPLVIGVKETDGGKQYCFSSETVALNYLGYHYIRDVAPGEVVFAAVTGELHSAVVADVPEKAPCMFEWVYFSSAESVQQGTTVYTARLNLGKQLGQRARQEIMRGKIAPDVVMPVPDTSRPAAIAAADVLGLPYREGLIKNRYVYRSFILNSQEKREEALELKLSPVRSEIEGKSIFLIDDSLVRGTTAKRIVALLKKYGAKNVTLGITCPPHRHACYYGIDFPDSSTLAARDRSAEDLAEWLGADDVIYLEEEDLRQALGISKLCMACLNGKYPTEIGEGVVFSAERKKSHAAGG
jgi:amidophosphoribosyltransferase